MAKDAKKWLLISPLNKSIATKAKGYMLKIWNNFIKGPPVVGDLVAKLILDVVSMSVCRLNFNE